MTIAPPFSCFIIKLHSKCFVFNFWSAVQLLDSLFIYSG